MLVDRRWFFAEEKNIPALHWIVKLHISRQKLQLKGPRIESETFWLLSSYAIEPENETQISQTHCRACNHRRSKSDDSP